MTTPPHTPENRPGSSFVKTRSISTSHSWTPLPSSQVWRKWLLGLSVGMLLATLAVNQLYTYYLSPDARYARSQGYPVRSYVDVVRISHDSKKRDLSSGEVDRLLQTAQESNTDVSYISMIALLRAHQPEDRSRTIRLARQRLHDSNGLIRMSALALLHKFDAPDVINIARSARVGDPEPFVQKYAQAIIDKRMGSLAKTANDPSAGGR